MPSGAVRAGTALTIKASSVPRTPPEPPIGGDNRMRRTGSENPAHRPVRHPRVREKHEQQGFCRGSETGDTSTPRALLEVGGNTRESGELFYVHEEFADEREKHAELF